MDLLRLIGNDVLSGSIEELDLFCRGDATNLLLDIDRSGPHCLGGDGNLSSCTGSERDLLRPTRAVDLTRSGDESELLLLEEALDATTGDLVLSCFGGLLDLVVCSEGDCDMFCLGCFLIISLSIVDELEPICLGGVLGLSFLGDRDLWLRDFWDCSPFSETGRALIFN